MERRTKPSGFLSIELLRASRPLDEFNANLLQHLLHSRTVLM
jgi:hypothetical protein